MRDLTHVRVSRWVVVAIAVCIVVASVGIAYSVWVHRGGRVERPEAEFSPGAQLSQVRVAILYERVTDGGLINRSLNDVVRIVEETGADMIFRGFWRWSPFPDDCSQLPKRLQAQCELAGYSYEHLEEATAAIKEAKPDLIFCGAVPAQKVQRQHEQNPRTGEILEYPETWELALDPSRWGINVSKERFQCWFSKTHLWVDRELDCADYDPEEANAYFPDITNEEFQELLLSWAEEQIDRGADAIWIDMLVTQARIMEDLTGDPNHPAVVDALKAAQRIVDEIHAYGKSKGRYVYVGSWSTAARFSHNRPDLDFVTVSPTIREVLTMELNESRWNEVVNLVRENLGDIPIFAFIDWAGTVRTPLGAFSQRLSPEQQREFLRKADAFLRERGIVFIYPVHGGYMGVDATVLSFGRYRFYDSIAPEFQTYQTIVELARSHKPTPEILFDGVIGCGRASWRSLRSRAHLWH